MLAGAVLTVAPPDELVLTGGTGIQALERVEIVPGVSAWRVTFTSVVPTSAPALLVWGWETTGYVEPFYTPRAIVVALSPQVAMDFFLVDASGTPVDPFVVMNGGSMGSADEIVFSILRAGTTTLIAS